MSEAETTINDTAQVEESAAPVEEVQDVAEETTAPESGETETVENAEEGISKAIEELGLEEKAETPEETPQEEAAPAPQPQNDLPPEQQEEQEILSSVKSARGKERLQKMLSERKENREKLQQLSGALQEAGLDEQGLSSMIQIASLLNSNDPATQERGLTALDTLRQEVYKQMGREAPGVDLLAGHDDLKAKVEAFELTKEDALEIANARNAKAAQQREAESQRMAQQAQYFDSLGKQVIEVFEQQRTKDPYFEQKAQALTKWFTPERMQYFATTVPTEQWISTLTQMFNSIDVGPQTAPKQQTATPITQNRARSTGRAVKDDMPATAEGIAQLIDEMGF